MTKDLQKVNKLLDEKEAKRKDRVSKAETDLKLNQDKLSTLRASLEKAESGEQFKTILSDIRDYEAVVEYDKKLVRDAESSILSEDEYKSVAATLRKNYEDIQTDKMSIIDADIAKLLEDMSAYHVEIEDLNSVAARVNSYHKSNPITFNPGMITAKSKRSTVAKNFFDVYYRLKALQINGQNFGVK